MTEKKEQHFDKKTLEKMRIGRRESKHGYGEFYADRVAFSSAHGRKNQFKARVVVECEKLGWTLSALAKVLGLADGSFHPILTRGNPTRYNIERIANALGVPVDKMYEPVTAAEYGEATFPRFGAKGARRNED